LAEVGFLNKTRNWVTVYVIVASIGLTMIGLVMLFSAGAVRGAQDLLFKQMIWVVISFLSGWYFSVVNLEWLRNRAFVIYAICIIGLILTLIPGIGVKVNGAQRWIWLGPLRIQPSEFAKIGIVIVMARYFADQQREVGSFLKGFVYPSLIIGISCTLIILQPDFGTCFLCGSVGALLMFQAGVGLRWLLPVAGLAVSVFSILVYFDPVRIRRVTSFLDVEANANDSAYQLWQGMLAFGVGGLEGVGLGMGRQQMYFLPEAHTDFIFPVIGEELGILATLGILLAFMVFFFSVCLKIRLVSRMNEYLLAMGALLFVVLQAIINMGVVTGCLPTKGMSLPFISYGGSNLVVTFIFVGLVINVMRRMDHPSPIQAREL
jgi:cell division protein FtsW